MSTNFFVALKKDQGNLHMEIRGDFDGSAAWQLIHLIHDKYDGKGEVVIDTQHLKQISPFGCSTFRCRLNRKALPAERLIFLGEKAEQIAPEGSRVIPGPHLCRCSGQCRECKCLGKGKRHGSAPIQGDVSRTRGSVYQALEGKSEKT